MSRRLLCLLAGVLLLSGASHAAAARLVQSAAPPGASDAAARVDAASRPSPEEDSVLQDPFVREQGKKGLDLLYNMQFAEARAAFNRIDQRYPNHPVGSFLKGLNLWWKILLDLTDTAHDEAFYRQMDEVIARCDEILDREPDHFDAAFFKGAALGLRGRLRSNRDQWFKAALDGKRAIGYVRDVAQRDPENHDYVFGKGMYDYYAAIIPEMYPVSKAVLWLMPDGDKERGLALIERTAEKGWYIQTEAVYFLAQIHYFYEKDFSETLKHVRWLREHHPDNPYFHNFEGRTYARWGRWSQAWRVFEDVVARREQGRSGYNVHMAEVAHYYLARASMVRRDYEQALVHLAELETLTARDVEDTRYRVLGYLYQGMAYDALGRRDMAVNRYRMVLRMDDYARAHERAEKYLEDPYGQ